MVRGWRDLSSSVDPVLQHAGSLLRTFHRLYHSSPIQLRTDPGFILHKFATDSFDKADAYT